MFNKDVFEKNGGLIALEDLELRTKEKGRFLFFQSLKQICIRYNVHKTDAQFSRANALLDEYFTTTQMEEGLDEEEPIAYPPWRVQNAAASSSPNQQQQQPFSF